MKHASSLAKHTTLALAVAALLLGAACKRTPAPEQTAAAGSEPAATASAPADTAGAPAADAKPIFDINSIPVSTASLGQFPYIGLPDGYSAQRASTSKFERVPFWTGDRVEWVEGQVYGAAVNAREGQPYSQLELTRNVQALVEGLGGREIFNGNIPQAALTEIQNSKAAVERVDALGDIYNEPANVYVIRQADRNIWVHLSKSGDGSGLMVAETKPVEITAKALPADALKKSLDADGKVAIQVQFDTDKANILPASRPQLEQVVALLNDNPDLRLSVNGHTDNTGDAQHNMQLSQRRAAAVRDFLTAAKIDGKRLESSGFGDTQPVADNNSEDGKARNRRVELVKL